MLAGAFLLLVLIIVGCSKVTTIKNPLKRAEPMAPQSIQLDKLDLTLQQLNTPPLTAYDPDKILNFFVQNHIFYVALRSEDGNTSTLQGFENKNGVLTPYKKFATNGVLTLKAKMLLGITLGIDGVVYYIRDGVHTLKSGNDIVSYERKTTATKIALTPGEHQAYLYGNDNFTLSDIKDDAFENNTPSFLHNRKAPFRGGLTLVQITNDGTIYGGGRVVPNGSNIIVSFDKKGHTLKTYGQANQTAKSAITNLVDMAVLKDYVCAIDGFNLKFWRKDGTYLGSFNTSKMLGNNLNAGKLAAISDNTLGVLAYLRNGDTKMVDISLFTLTFPEPAKKGK
jgi:hypothetical protein